MRHDQPGLDFNGFKVNRSRATTKATHPEQVLSIFENLSRMQSKNIYL